MSADTRNGRDGDSSRPLTPLERQVIAALLIDDCPGVNELRAQLDTARVIRAWAMDSSPSIDLEVSSGMPAAPLRGSNLPVNAYVYDDHGVFQGELILWLSNGKISALEYAWVTDSSPLSLPTVDMIRVSLR